MHGAPSQCCAVKMFIQEERLPPLCVQHWCPPLGLPQEALWNFDPGTHLHSCGWDGPEVTQGFDYYVPVLQRPYPRVGGDRSCCKRVHELQTEELLVQHLRFLGNLCRAEEACQVGAPSRVPEGRESSEAADVEEARAGEGDAAFAWNYSLQPGGDLVNAGASAGARNWSTAWCWNLHILRSNMEEAQQPGSWIIIFPGRDPGRDGQFITIIICKKLKIAVDHLVGLLRNRRSIRLPRTCFQHPRLHPDGFCVLRISYIETLIFHGRSNINDSFDQWAHSDLDCSSKNIP